MLNFLKTLSPDAIAYLVVLAAFAALSVVFIVRDCRNRRETRRSDARREYLARKEAVERKARQQF
ncbi:hypothetical protein [Serratia fonticola]